MARVVRGFESPQSAPWLGKLAATASARTLLNRRYGPESDMEMMHPGRECEVTRYTSSPVSRENIGQRNREGRAP